MRRMFLISTMSLSSLLATLFTSAPSWATGTRYFHASECKTRSGTTILNSFGQLEVNATSGISVVWCPVDLDPTVNDAAAGARVEVNVYGNTTSSSQLFGRVCRVFAAGGGSGQTCNGVNVITTPLPGVGMFSMTVPTPAAGDYLYAELNLGPHTSAGGDNAVFGYRLVNP
jgi:hypothetical protein